MEFLAIALLYIYDLKIVDSVVFVLDYLTGVNIDKVEIVKNKRDCEQCVLVKNVLTNELKSLNKCLEESLAVCVESNKSTDVLTDIFDSYYNERMNEIIVTEAITQIKTNKWIFNAIYVKKDPKYSDFSNLITDIDHNLKMNINYNEIFENENYLNLCESFKTYPKLTIDCLIEFLCKNGVNKTYLESLMEFYKVDMVNIKKIINKYDSLIEWKWYQK